MPKTKKPKSAPKNGKKKKQPTMAAKADRYDLYLRSVQEPSHEVQFFNRTFKKIFGRKPCVLREDFCGTAAICYEWVRKKPERRAIGVDIDPEPLAWGLEHLATQIKPVDLERVELLQDDVRKVQGEKADVLAAQNFSFWCFKTRKEVLEYFRAAHANIAREGMMILDMMGGAETLEEDHEEESEKDGFDYVWDQVLFDPITHDCKFHIHFRFPDRSEMKKAFTYEWRLWSLPEVTELLTEAGFDTAEVYWEGTDSDGEGDNIYKPRKRGTADPSWIAYVIATKGTRR